MNFNFRFVLVSRPYYRGAAGVLIFFDLTRRDSFLNVKRWFDEVTTHAELHPSQMILIGTKKDMVKERQVSFEEANELARHLGVLLFEVSAKENINIEEAVTALVSDIEKQRVVEEPKKIPLERIRNSSPPKPFFCCSIL